MAIGDVKLKTGRSLQQEENIVPGMFGEGIAKAIGGLASATGDVAQLTAGLKERANKDEEFETRKNFLEHEGEQNRLLAEGFQSAAPGAAGETNRAQAHIKVNNQAFLETVPKRLQGQYTPLLEELNQAHVNKAFTFEYEEGNKLFRQKVVTATDMEASNVRGGKTTLKTAKDNLLELIKLSDLPAQEKETQIVSANQALIIADYARATTASLVLEQPVRAVMPGKAEPDVVLSGTGPGMRGLANTIAKGESGSRYDVRYDGTAGGATFTDYSDHPRIAVALNDGAGNSSTAAGKYQIIAPTWDMAAAELGLTDFLPASQDKAFAWLAEQRFEKIPELRGMTLESALTSANPKILEQVHEALKPEWEYLKKVSLDQFISEVQEGKLASGKEVAVPGIAAGAVGTPAQPDLWNDPLYADLTYAQKAKMYTDSATKAKKFHTERKKVAKEQHTAQYNTAVMDASTGALGLADEAALKQAGVLSTFPEVTAYRKAVDDWKTRVSSTAELQAKFNNPNHVFTGSENKAWNNFFGEAGKEALGAMDQNYLNTALTPTVQRIGYIPSDSAKVLETMVATGSLQQRAFALETLSTYHGQNPQLLERTTGMSKGMKRTVGQYTMLKPFYSESEITEKFKQLRDPTFAKQHAELVAAGVKSFRADVSTADMLGTFTSFANYIPGFADAPVLPLTAGQQNVFRQEFEMNFAQGWALNPDSSTATEYATKQMQRQWSVSSIGGENRLVRNAPESYYPTINEDYNWIDYTTRRDLGLTSEIEFSLVADGQTRKEASTFQQTGEGNNASYMIGVKDAEGNYGLKMDATGAAPLRIAFDPEDPELTAGINWVTSYTNLTQQIGDTTARYLDLLERPESNPAEVELLQGLLQEQLDSATVMRESRVTTTGQDNESITNRLLADMEAEAQFFYAETIPGGARLKQVWFKDYYEKLEADILRLGGTVPTRARQKVSIDIEPKG